MKCQHSRDRKSETRNVPQNMLHSERKQPFNTRPQSIPSIMHEEERYGVAGFLDKNAAGRMTTRAPPGRSSNHESKPFPPNAQCRGKSPFWSIKPAIRDQESHCISAPSFVFVSFSFPTLLQWHPLSSFAISPQSVTALHHPLTD